YAKVANLGMQILGAYGYTMEFDMQRHFRDSRASTIAAGTSQIQRNLIANLMGLSSASGSCCARGDSASRCEPLDRPDPYE
ncbi:MAG: acyl-CoA dehydrogenase family protein, partial [Xanthobacteraceae bacterium]